jgi:aminoglycoside 6'-N-acetyltransferase I
MGDEIVIELAGSGSTRDVTALAERFFREEGFDLPPEGLRARVAEYLAREGQEIAVARRGSELVGFGTVNSGFGLEYGWVAELEDLYVVPELRRAGVARRLVDHLAAWAAGRECSALLVTITPEGERSHGLMRFYARLGFEDRGRRLIERPLS